MSRIPDLRARSPRMRRTRVIAAGAAAVCLVVAGCANNQPPGADRKTTDGGSIVSVEPGKSVATSPIPKLTVGFSPAYTSLDPTAGKAGSGYYYMGQLSLETLLQLTPDGKLQPGLAASWKQNSPTEYVYNLRQGVKFWDGKDFTADDVVFSLTRDGGESFGKSGFYGSVDKIEARDPHTVVVKLKKPDTSWKYTPALPYSQIYQKAFTEAHKDSFGAPGTLVMGTGPWKVTKFDPNKGAEYTANPAYWGGEPPIKQLNVNFYQTETSLALAMRAGQVDVAPAVAAPDSFASSSGVKVTTRSTCGTSLFSMPTQTAPWNDIHVRLAVAAALDKKELLKATAGADVDTLDTLIAPSLLHNIGDPAAADAALAKIEKHPYDLAKAKEELAKSSKPTGFSGTLTSTNDQGSLRISQAIAAQLKKIGINLEIVPLSTTAYYEVLLGPAEKRPPTYITTGGCSPDASWDNFFLGDGGLNVANYHPAEMDQLLVDGKSATDPAKQLQTYTRILEMIATDVPYVPLFHEGATYASKNYEWVNFGDYWTSTSWPMNFKPR